MSKLDLEQLRIELRGLQRWHDLYKVLKEELSVKGYWRLRARGNPVKAHAVSEKVKRDKKKLQI